MLQFLQEFGQNLRVGIRLACFKPCSIDEFSVSMDHLVALVILEFILRLGSDYIFALPEPIFDFYILPVFSFDVVLFCLIIFFGTRLWKKPALFLPIAVAASSISTLNVGIGVISKRFLETNDPDLGINWLASIIALFPLIIMGRALFIASDRCKSLSVALLASLIFANGFIHQRFSSDGKFWYASETSETGSEQESDRWAAYREMDGERVMYNQPELLNAALESLQPERPNHSDIFFVGFASYATEDVFSKEISFAQNLLDERFETAGHSIRLANHLTTRDQIPLANETNLATTLKHIGSLMNRDEDVLVLYLTSHGSSDHRLAVSFPPLPLNDITPENLRDMLDEAGIKWRVIIVSACYSGGFIPSLTDDHSLVATAAAADKTSFGCGTESEFTYFGEAVFKDRLPNEYSFVNAIQQAQKIISEREQREHIDASSPQLWVGDAARSKLERLSEELRLQRCASATGGAC